MRDPGADHATMAVRRERMLNAAYRLFTEKSITSVTLEEIAREAGCGKKTLLRYYDSKLQLVIAVAVHQWGQVLQDIPERNAESRLKRASAREEFVFYLDSFIGLYLEHRELLRFNQLFNVYVQSEQPDTGTLEPYQDMIKGLAKRFHVVYEKAERDHTIRTDIPEHEMFSATLHLMLAVVTRYAVGLVYQSEEGFDAVKELEVLKEALLAMYTP